MELFELFIPQSQALHHPWSKALQHNIHVVHHALKNLTSLLSLQVYRNTALIAIYSNEIQAHTTRAMWRHGATIITTAWLFDFDDIRAEVRQHLRCIGAGKQA